MLNAVQGPARERLSAREQIDQAEVARLRAAGLLVVDDRRRRPLYFDGRFLAARDLTRDQTYFLTRQADLGQATGAGVVHGLQITRGAGASALQISPGHGITPSGELVILRQPVAVTLDDVPLMQRLDAAFGLLPRPREPSRTRTGLYVLALRPVEFSANPIASYPTQINGQRSVEDGDIVEATAITLLPVGDSGSPAELDQRRARLAREIFVAGSTRAFPDGALPLAVVALQRNVIEWIDSFLVRREAGAGDGDLLRFASAPRAAREAFLLQYEQHLQDVLRQRDQANRGRRFAAAEHFLALPPGGRMPSAAIDPVDFTQTFFPAEVQVDLTIVPDDEILPIIEESLYLPPIDLTLTGEQQESTAVLAMIPVPRAGFRLMSSRLAGGGTAAPVERRLQPAAPGLVASRKPLQALQRLTFPRLPVPALPPADPVAAAWREALASTDLLWYVRRRNLPYRADVAGEAARLLGDETPAEREVATRVQDAGLTPTLDAIRSKATAGANADLLQVLATPAVSGSPALMHDLVTRLSQLPTIDRAAVAAAAQPVTDPQVVEGIKRVEAVAPELTQDPQALSTLVSAGAVDKLGTLGARLTDDQLKPLAGSLLDAARRGDTQAVATLVSQPLEGITR